MGNISVDFLESGMELAADVRAPNGMVLLGEGATITERHIGILKSWEVIQVEIKGTSPDTPDAGKLSLVSDAQKARINAELDRQFQHNDPFDPVVEELRRICCQRELERVASVL